MGNDPWNHDTTGDEFVRGPVLWIVAYPKGAVLMVAPVASHASVWSADLEGYERVG